jgi:hypothetical protein
VNDFDASQVLMARHERVDQGKGYCAAPLDVDALMRGYKLRGGFDGQSLPSRFFWPRFRPYRHLLS